jgi:hypothetical protein
LSDLLTDPQAEPELEAPREPMPSQKVVRRRRLLMLLSAMALLLAGMVAWASQSAWLLGRVREEVSAAVTGSMAGGRMRLGGLSGSLWGPLELSGIALEDGSGVAVVKVAKVRVNYRILPLLNRRLVVTELAVEGFEADGVIEADGGLNFGRLLKPSAPSAARLPVSVVTGSPGWWRSVSSRFRALRRCRATAPQRLNWSGSACAGAWAG